MINKQGRNEGMIEKEFLQDLIYTPYLINKVFILINNGTMFLIILVGKMSGDNQINYICVYVKSCRTWNLVEELPNISNL